jgi:hypothetical protein
MGEISGKKWGMDDVGGYCFQGSVYIYKYGNICISK